MTVIIIILTQPNLFLITQVLSVTDGAILKVNSHYRMCQLNHIVGPGLSLLQFLPKEVDSW